MNELLARVLREHGGFEHWHRFNNVAETLVSGGEVLDRKAPPYSLTTSNPAACRLVSRALLADGADSSDTANCVPNPNNLFDCRHRSQSALSKHSRGRQA
jgi:hypothetical protein